VNVAAACKRREIISSGELLAGDVMGLGRDVQGPVETFQPLGDPQHRPRWEVLMLLGCAKALSLDHLCP